jgi:hypothetical protein
MLKLLVTALLILALQGGCAESTIDSPSPASNPPILNGVDRVKQQLPSNLGPRAKREFLRALPNQTILCTAELAANANPERLEPELSTLDATISSWDETTRLLVLELPAARLVDLAALDGVVYVELAQRYSF